MAAAGDTLVLTGEVDRPLYCVDTDDDMLRLYLRMHLTNPGPGPVVMYKGLGNVTNIRVATTKEGLNGATPLLDIDETPITTLTHLSASSFVTLAAGQVFTFDAMVPINVRKNHAIGGPALEPGKYRMSVVVPLWEGDQETAETWQKRLPDRGPLLLGSVKSGPIGFVVDASYRAVVCKDR
jgi:hypothetical protein